jgi:hypothetical protein
MSGLSAGLCTAVMSDESGAAVRSRDERSTLSLLLVAQLLLLLARGIGVDCPDSKEPCTQGSMDPPLGVAWPSEAEMTTPATVVLIPEPLLLFLRGLGHGPPKASKRRCETRRALGSEAPSAIRGVVDPDPPPLPLPMAGVCVRRQP